MGNAESNIQYCKKDGKWFEYGTPAKATQGRRTDLLEIKEAIDGGATLRDVADQDFGTYLRYHRSLSAYRASTIRSGTWEKPEVIVRWGLPGSGKTRYVYDNHPLEDIWSWPGENWFDGYDGQPIVLFDDFDGTCKITFRMLLRLLDRYPIDVPFKGGYAPWRPKIIYITTNVEPNNWYPQNDQDYHAIHRRIDQLIHVVAETTDEPQATGF